MSFAETVLLGAIAGITIYIGLPLGRMERVSERMRLALAMFSVGILAFIFMDVSAHGEAIVGTRSPVTSTTHRPRARDRAVCAAGGRLHPGTAGIGTVERRCAIAAGQVHRPIAGGASGHGDGRCRSPA